MNTYGRFDPSNITISRLFKAIKTRASEIPHSIAWNISPHAQLNKEYLRKYKNLHIGQRCFIVANGPSLQKTNLDLLANEVTFGLNRIYLNFDESPFRPTYQVIVNELILEQCANEILRLNMPKFLNWNRRSLFQINNANTMFLKSKMVIKDSFQYDLTHPLVVGATVTFVALQLAYYMGFSKVILIGLDHDYTESGIPSKSEIRTSDTDKDHFHKNYFPKGFRWQLPDLLRSEIDFSIARKAYEADGREIIDSTIGGKCPVFNKAEFSSLFR
ncbi:MAG: hypothetical protein ACD_35C00310G0002 [uncultured bacterium]|nr:MAG: hypothetical protein ACD_35C00310G0002 [uncultured bacterium]HCS40037.1 hypothetical protein [Anaerolineaceae bacterium]